MTPHTPASQAAPWPEGVDRRVFQTLDSTNLEAARRIAEMSGPTWLLALEQTAAKGRRGRAWMNPVGNFAATLVLPGQVAPTHAAQRSFVAALALHDACVAVTGRPDAFALKWPNDVLQQGGKMAGILLETLTDRHGICGLAIGIGVNLATAPDAGTLETGAVPPAALSELTDTAVSPQAFLDHLAPAFAAHMAQHDRMGFAPIRTAWLARAAKLGETITARMPGDEVTGVFEDLAPDGALVLATPRGNRHVAAADIFF